MALNGHTTSSSPASKSFLRGSPRSSLDSPSGVASSSPFLQNLQQRFRKTSSASSNGHTSADLLQQSQQHRESLKEDTKSRAEASRSVKRYLLEVVRDGWEFHSPQELNEDGLGAVEKEPVSWRQREDGLSDIESDASHARKRSKSDPYRFENPDAVADYVEKVRRKRRKVLREEMEWNEGMSNWVKQRDAWTGATRRSETTRKRLSAKLSSALHERNTSDCTDGSMPSALSLESGTGTGAASSNESLEGAGHEDEPWLPIYPQLFDEDNILRSRIQPTAYPTIYSKVVLQSLTPNIPIPLNHMVKVLVEGWKSEGNWPPSAAQVVAADLKQGKVSSRFARWRMGSKDGQKERVKKSIGLMKKAVRLDGGEDAGIGFEGDEAQDIRSAERDGELNKSLLG
jgi:Protein of unknown function (DUF4050)